jgi:SpoIID/LytB domain protein
MITGMRFSRATGVALIAGLLAGVLAPSPASAETTVVIDGGGWGHGIGMSQYGAYGRALKGKSATDILEHYYSGAKVSTGDLPKRIRVGLLQYRSSISATSTPLAEGSTGRVVFRTGDDKIADGPKGTTWRVEPSTTGGMRLYRNDTQVKRGGVSVFGTPEQPLKAFFEPYGSILRINEKSQGYAYGTMEFASYATERCEAGYCLRLVVSLPMQKYLYGLGEVPASWPGAALRAQAIAGRTYAFDKTIRSGQRRYPCDCAVYDSTLDQAYIGDGKRSGSGEYWDDWKAAVDETNGQVILYDSVPIQALYSSSSGGYTENNENVWGGTPIPYLRGVRDGADAVDANPNHTWSVEMSYSSFEDKLNAAYGTGSVQSFELLKPFGVSGRVTVVQSETAGGARIVGDRKTVRASGWSLRAALGLKDTLFRVEITYPVGERFVRKYRRLDKAPGYPVGEPYQVPRNAAKSLGQAQDFKSGRMTWRSETDKTVWQYGNVLDRYDTLGRERSNLGMPTSDIWGPGEYLGASFVEGLIVWSASTGAHSVQGVYEDAYVLVGGVKGGVLGLPLKQRERRDTLPKGGSRQRFQNGTLYRNPKAAAVFALWGAIDARYRKLGEATSKCGYPISSLTEKKGSQSASFERGTIQVAADGNLTVSCS